MDLPVPDRPSADLTPMQRMKITFELHELGVAMMREQLRRRHPDETDEQIEQRLRAWLLERPGAEHGDTAEGPLRPIPPQWRSHDP